MITLSITTNKARQILANVYKLDSSAFYCDNKKTLIGDVISSVKDGNNVTISSNYFFESTLIEKCILPSVKYIKKTVSSLKHCTHARVYLNLQDLTLSFAQFSNSQSYIQTNDLQVYKFASYKGKPKISELKDAIVESLQEYFNR